MPGSFHNSPLVTCVRIGCVFTRTPRSKACTIRERPVSRKKNPSFYVVNRCSSFFAVSIRTGFYHIIPFVVGQRSPPVGALGVRVVCVGAFCNAVRILCAADGDCAANAGAATESLSNTLSSVTFIGSDFCYCVGNGNSSDG